MTTAIILAGGLGTRLRSVVSDRPKPMALVSDKPFIQWLMDYWIRQGITRFIVSVGYKAAMVSDYFGREYQGCPIDYAVEQEPLGTGGGLVLAMQKLTVDEPFLLLNGDTFFAVSLPELLAFHQHHHSACTFSLFRASEADRYMGIEVTLTGQIQRFESAKGQMGDLANGGVYLMEPAILRPLYDSLVGHRLSLEDDIFDQLLQKQCAVFGCECSGRFIDIGVPRDYARAADVMDIRTER